MIGPIAAFLRPSPDEVVEQLRGAGADELVARPPEVVLDDAAMFADEHGGGHPSPGLRDAEVEAPAQRRPEVPKLVHGEEVGRIGTDSPHGLPVDLAEVVESGPVLVDPGRKALPGGPAQASPGVPP